MINIDVISKLKPCQDRLDNYVKHYGNREFTNRQFMGLKNITHNDKLWVAFHTITVNGLLLAGADIIESVLHIYETAYPNDLRPRKAIEASRLYAAGNITARELRIASLDAYCAYASAAPVAYAYANDTAVAYAAAVFATAAAVYSYYFSNSVIAAPTDDSAIIAAAYYVAYSGDPATAAFYASYSSIVDAATKSTQEKLIRTIILRYWK